MYWEINRAVSAKIGSTALDFQCAYLIAHRGLFAMYPSLSVSLCRPLSTVVSLGVPLFKLIHKSDRNTKHVCPFTLGWVRPRQDGNLPPAPRFGRGDLCTGYGINPQKGYKWR